MLANTADVDKALDDFQKSGMDVLRIWGFADLTGDPGSQTAFQVSSVPGEYGYVGGGWAHTNRSGAAAPLPSIQGQTVLKGLTILLQQQEPATSVL